MFANILKTLTNLFTPKPTPAPKAASTQKSTFVPQISTNQGTKTFGQTAPQPQYSTPKSAVGMSTNQGAVYNSGTGTRSVTTGNPVQVSAPSYERPTAPSYNFVNSLQGLVQNLAKPMLQPLTNAMSTISSNQLTKPTGIQSTITQALGKAGGALNSFGTAIGAPQLAPGGFGAQLQNFAGNMLARPVQASENTMTPLKPTNTPDSSSSSWRPPSVIAAEKKWADENRGNLQADLNRLQTITPGLQQQNDAYDALKAKFQSGQITQDEFMKQAGDLMSITQAGGDVSKTNPYTQDALTGSYIKADSAGAVSDPTTKSFNDSIQAIYDEQSKAQQPILDAMWNEVQNGNTSYEDYLKKQDEVQRQAIISAYDKAKQDAESQIPLIQQDYTNAQTQEKNLLDQFLATLSKQKTDKSNTYDQSLATSVKNQKLEEARLRNVFANLGTAESSSFIDKMTGLAQDAAGNQSDIERQKLADLSAIDTTGTNEQTNYATRIANLLSGQNKDISAIRSGISANEGKQASDLAGLTSTLLQNLATGKANATTAKQGIYNTQLTQAQKLQDYLTQYQISNQLAKDQSQFNTASIQGNTTIGNKIRPSGLPSDMWGLASQLYNSGVRGADIVTQLKSRGGVGWNSWYDTLKNLLT